MDKIKVLHIITAEVWGGGEEAAYSMCNVLSINNYEVYTILSSKNDFFVKRFSECSIVKNINLNSYNKILNIFKIKKFIIDNNIKIVNVHSGKIVATIVLLKYLINDLKIVSFRHNLLNSKKDLLHKFLYSKIDIFICVSEAVYNQQIRNISSKIKNKFHIVHNGIDIKKYETYLSKNDRKHNDIFTVGYAGRIEENKGLYILIKAVESLSKKYQVNLKIAGDYSNTYGEFIQEYIKDKKDIFELTGFQKNMNDFYQSIDFFVLPSIVPEAFGLVLCEAMFYEKPVITTDSGAQHEIINKRIDGFIISKNSVEQLEEVLEFLIKNPLEARKIGRNAKQKVISNFTIDIWFEKMDKIYRFLL